VELELPFEMISSRGLGWKTMKLSGLGRSLARLDDDGMIYDFVRYAFVFDYFSQWDSA
jgi:hypothetical protein